MNRSLNSGFRVAQGFREAKNPADNWISGSYAIFYLFQNVFFNHTRRKMRLSASINGTGFMIKKELIDEVGFDTKTLTEDVEFSGLCALRNEKIDFVEGAITYDEFGICRIDEDKCIQCGHCIHSCPFGAIGSKTYLVDIIRHIKAGDEVIAMVAPATEGQFGADITMQSLKNVFLDLGFSDMVEVGLGGDMTAAYESLEWSEAAHEGRKMTTSCCPAFINMQRKHFPKVFEENVSSVVSPMCAVSRYLKSTRPGCITVFVGPCIAKKSEAEDPTIPDNADYVITYGEFRAMLRSKDIDIQAAANSYQESSIWGKRFATSGGVAKAVLECMQERGEDISGIKLVQVAGGDACKKTLTMLKAGRLPESFVEGMICEGGCVGGPSRHRTEMEIKRAREGLLKMADDRKVLDNLKNYPMDKFSMYRDGHMDEKCLLD